MIRPAVAADVPTLVALVRELADYERAPDAAVLDEEALHGALFGPAPAVFARRGCRRGLRSARVPLWRAAYVCTEPASAGSAVRRS